MKHPVKKIVKRERYSRALGVRLDLKCSRVLLTTAANY